MLSRRGDKPNILLLKSFCHCLVKELNLEARNTEKMEDPLQSLLPGNVPATREQLSAAPSGLTEALLVTSYNSSSTGPGVTSGNALESNIQRSQEKILLFFTELWSGASLINHSRKAARIHTTGQAVSKKNANLPFCFIFLAFFSFFVK